MDLDLLLKNGNSHGDVYVTRNCSGLTVYVGGRLLVQIRDGTVTAFQTHGAAQARFAQSILDHEGLHDRYYMMPDSLIEYVKGEPIRVETPIELMRRIGG